MIDFLINNIGTIIVGLILLAVLVLISAKMVRDKRHGKTSCGCGCEHCQNAEYCHGGKK